MAGLRVVLDDSKGPSRDSTPRLCRACCSLRVLAPRAAALQAEWPVVRTTKSGARVYTGFQRRGPNRVEITVHAEPIRIGSLYGADLAPLRALCAAITRGGVPCETSDDIEGELWSKMLYNCSLNPLGALIGVAYGELAQYPETRSILEAVIAEIFALLDATGRRTRWRDAAEYLEIFWNELLPPTAAHESSMLQDLRAGRRTEVEALNGAVVELAREHGLEMPVNRALLELIRAREQQRSRPP